jgi:hypothetical protein
MGGEVLGPMKAQ